MSFLDSCNGRFFGIKPGTGLLYLLGLLLCSMLQVSCTKKATPFEPTDPLGIANKWIYDSMKLYYYWNDEITSHPNYSLPSKDFFKQLLSSKDRFSRLTNRNESQAGLTTAEQMGFYWSFIDHPGDLYKKVGVITFVVPASVSDKQGMQRGMFFTKVNGEELRVENADRIAQALISGTSVQLQLATLDNNGTSFTPGDAITIQHGVVPLKCVYSNRYFEKNGIRTGYLAYYICGEWEDEILMHAIQQLKNAGVTSLVLDLRFNPGGSVASVAKLAAVLVPSFNPDALFVTYKGNKYGGVVKQTFRQAIAFSGNQYGKDMGTLQSLNLHLSKVFILTSHNTASAAELLTNNLKPYAQVTMIGEKTLGKDEASFRIEDKRTPRQIDWILSPIVYKVADAQGRGDYSSGLPPDYAINEFSSLPLPAPGLPGDLSLNKALELIYGNTNVEVVEMKVKQKVMRFGVLE